MNKNIFAIGQRVAHQGFRGIICSAPIFGVTPAGFRFTCYLVEFDKVNGKQPNVSNAELNHFSSFFAINESFLFACP